MKRILLTLTPFSRFFFVSSSKKLQATLVIKRIVSVPIRKLFLPCFNHSGNYEEIFFFQVWTSNTKKADLISESFSLWLQSLLGAKNYPKHLLFRWIELKNCDLTHILGDLGDFYFGSNLPKYVSNHDSWALSI